MTLHRRHLLAHRRRRRPDHAGPGHHDRSAVETGTPRLHRPTRAASCSMTAGGSPSATSTM
ncbi:MAG: hypothetical protein WDN06_13860 [Asticcacaulis sp.]